MKNDRAELRIRLRDLAATRFDYGYRRLHILLKRQGWTVNHKPVYRIYKEESLTMRRKKPRRNRSSTIGVERAKAVGRNDSWSMDFMADQLFNGTRFRVLTLVDNYSRESITLRVGKNFTSDQVVACLEAAVKERGKPASIRVDNGPEFISKSLDWWAYFNGVTLDFSRPGKSTDNAFIESFNRRVRQECLNEHRFLSLDDAQTKLNVWRIDYNRL